MPINPALVVGVLLVLTGPAFADGTVLRAKGCGDKIFVGLGDVFSVLIASQRDSVADGDTIVGDINRVGFGSFYDSKSGRRFTASVDERGLDKSAVTVRIAVSCRSQTAFNLATGQVERADGCGNKI